MIDWTDNSVKSVFDSSLGKVNIKIDKLSVTINDYFERQGYEQITSELLDEPEFKDKIVCCSEFFTYLVKK